MDYAPRIPSESCDSLRGQSLQWPGETPLPAGRPLRSCRVENTWLAENADDFCGLKGRC